MSRHWMPASIFMLPQRLCAMVGRAWVLSDRLCHLTTWGILGRLLIYLSLGLSFLIWQNLSGNDMRYFMWKLLSPVSGTEMVLKQKPSFTYSPAESVFLETTFTVFPYLLSSLLLFIFYLIPFFKKIS